jgi:ribose transport system permease protein
MEALVSADVGLIVLIALFFAAFWLFAPGFNSPFNLFGLSRFTAINIVIGLSMMVVIVTGGLDLSVGAMGVSAVMLAGWLMEVAGLPVALAIAGGLALGATLGALNGIVIVRTGVHSFIVTLATMSIYFGAMIVVTHAGSFRNLPSDFSTPAKLRWFGFVSPTLLVAAGAALGLFVLYRFTALGRRMLAAGANSRAAEMSGVPVGRVVTLCHMLGGALAALAGMLLAMRTGAAIPSMAGNLGQDWLLPAFLGPVLGGTSLTGGRVSVLGTALGATLVTVLTSGLLLLQVGEFWVQFFLGALLLTAVLLEKARVVLLAARRMSA